MSIETILNEPWVRLILVHIMSVKWAFKRLFSERYVSFVWASTDYFVNIFLG